MRGKYRVSCYDVGEEWEGKWDGRTVIVRTIRQPRPSEVISPSHQYGDLADTLLSRAVITRLLSNIIQTCMLGRHCIHASY